MKASVIEVNQQDGPGGCHNTKRESLFIEYNTIDNTLRESKNLDDTIKPMISKNDHEG